MLSLLRKRLATSGSIFAKEERDHWVVWEPGKWAVSSGFDPTKAPRGPTHEGLAIDSLAFQLKKREPIRLGRSTDCDIVINDATVSREHLTLTPVGESAWSVTSVTATGTTRVGETQLSMLQTVELKNGDRLSVGDVKLTYYDTAGLTARLTQG
jgi:hypothetical protein